MATNTAIFSLSDLKTHVVECFEARNEPCPRLAAVCLGKVDMLRQLVLGMDESAFDSLTSADKDLFDEFHGMLGRARAALEINHCEEFGMEGDAIDGEGKKEGIFTTIHGFGEDDAKARAVRDYALQGFRLQIEKTWPIENEH